MVWNLQFPDWVVLKIILPYFNLNPHDLLNISGSGGVSERLSGGGGEIPTFIEMGPLLHLDITLAVNLDDQRNALGFILVYQGG